MFWKYRASQEVSAIIMKQMKSSFPKPLTSTPTYYSFTTQVTAKKPIFNTKFTANRKCRYLLKFGTEISTNSNSTMVRTASWPCHKIYTFMGQIQNWLSLWRTKFLFFFQFSFRSSQKLRHFMYITWINNHCTPQKKKKKKKHQKRHSHDQTCNRKNTF